MRETPQNTEVHRIFSGSRTRPGPCENSRGIKNTCKAAVSEQRKLAKVQLRDRGPSLRQTPATPWPPADQWSRRSGLCARPASIPKFNLTLGRRASSIVWRCLILGHHEKLAPSDCHATHRSRPRLNDRRYLKTRPSGQRPRRQFLLGGGCPRIPGGVYAKLNKPLATGPPPRTTTGDVHNGVTGVQALDWLAALSREKKAAILRIPRSTAESPMGHPSGALDRNISRFSDPAAESFTRRPQAFWRPTSATAGPGSGADLYFSLWPATRSTDA
jgi:hypothetical protein